METKIYGIFQKYVVNGEENKTESPEQILWCVTSEKEAVLEVKRLYEKHPNNEDSFLIYKYFYKPIPVY